MSNFASENRLNNNKFSLRQLYDNLMGVIEQRCKDSSGARYRVATGQEKGSCRGRDNETLMRPHLVNVRRISRDI